MPILTAVLGGAAGAAVISGIFSLVLWRWNRKAALEDKKDEKEDDMIAGLRIILYDRIKYLGRKYISEYGVTVEDLQDLIAMHTIYHDRLGGNGFLDSLMTQVKALQIIERR